jgi:hypothetical protein
MKKLGILLLALTALSVAAFGGATVFQRSGALTQNRVMKISLDSTNDPTLANSTITDDGSAVTFDQQFNATLNNVGNSSTAVTVNWNDSNIQLVTLTGNATLTFTNPASGGRYVLIVKQDATGSRTVTWPAAVLWSGGSAPTLTTTASKVDVISFLYDNVNSKYYAGSTLNY